MGARTALIKAEIKTNTADWKILMDPKKTGARAFFLERGIESKSFVVVHEATEGLTFEADGFRQLMFVKYATLLENFPDLIARSSYMAVGIPDTGGSFDVFEIDPSRRDVYPPNSDDPSWKVYLLRMPTERFIPS